MADRADVHHPRGVDVCTDCGRHADARIHHTPGRVAGAVGPAIGALMRQNPVEQGAILLATALRPEGHGWGALAGPAEEALRDLAAAGWTPPSGPDTDEAARLRVELESACRRIDDLNGHLDRVLADVDAADAFRACVVEAAFEDARRDIEVSVLKADTEKRFTRWQVHEALGKLLDQADRAADSARKRRVKNAAVAARRQERAQLALFAQPVPADGAQTVVPVGEWAGAL